MFITRLLSGIVLLAIIISTGILGGPVFWSLVTLISLLGLFEYHRMIKLEKSSLFYASGLLCIALDTALFFGKTDLADAMPVFGILLLMAMYVIRYPKFEAKDVFASFMKTARVETLPLATTLALR